MPYVLYSQGLAWIRMGISGRQEKSKALRHIYGRISEGCERHPSNLELLQLHSDLKKAELTLVIPGFEDEAAT